MRFVNLTNHMLTENEKADIKDLKSKELIDKPSYKLENIPSLIWCAKEREDEFYSDWESVQPKECKYAVYYEPKSTTYTIKPRELFAIRKELLQSIRECNNSRNIVLDYVREKTHQRNIEHIMCQIDTSTDVADLHTLFNTENVTEVVEGYAKSFSAIFWNYIDEKDQSYFQVPSLMIMDSNCMNITDVVTTIPYHQRQNGVDKITGIATRQSNIDEILKLLNSDLNLSNAVDLLKLKRDLNEPSIINAIETKLSDFKMLDYAEKIMQRDELANQFYIVSSDNKELIKQQILLNPELQEELQKRRLGVDNSIDIYMATYVDILEEINRNRFFKSADIKRQNAEITSDDIGRIPKVKNIESTPIKEWFRKSFDRFKNVIER